MIETLCGCGKSVRLASTAAQAQADCAKCGKRVRVAAGEVVDAEAALGDFDSRLVVDDGPDGVGDTIVLGGVPDLQLGKLPDRHIVLNGNLVSRHHAKLVRLDFGPSRWKVVDTNSRNGVLVNGQRVAEAELTDGCVLTVGDYRLKYLVGSPEPEPVAPTPAAKPKPGQLVCKGCGNAYAATAKLCTACGIDLKTGKMLITSKGLDENEIAIRADTWIRIISWFVWFGLFPIASEAYATHKPRVTWAITALTIAISFGFLAAVVNNQGQVPDSLKNYMLWVGEPPHPTAQADVDLPVNSTHLSPEQKRQMDELLRQIRAQQTQDDPSLGQFHFYQFFTNVFLHAGIMHLAGNLVFFLVFGLRVNEMIGDLKMAIVYPLLGLCSGLVYAAAEMHGPLRPALGASGAIMGLAGMYFVFFPLHRVYMAIWLRGGILTRWRVYYKVWQMKGVWLLALWVGFNDILPTVLHATGITSGASDHTAHWAHLGGFIAGAGLALALLVARQVNAHGADIVSVTLGTRAWSLIGRPEDRAALAAA